MRTLAFLAALTVAFAPAVAEAQFASLVADEVRVDGRKLIAEGNVEILHEGRRLRASRIVYDGAAHSVTIDGPISLAERDGESVVIGESGELDADLENGILRGARLVLNEQMQIAAAELNRAEGRYSQLYTTVASSCRVCPDDPVPLWQIRSRRVVHDQVERQLYFSNARFEVLGLPIAYFPVLRLPDPTLERATGFLIPEISNSTELSSGVKIPYFVAIGDHADLTFTPYLSPRTRTIETRYRQALRDGDIGFEGAVSRDSLRDGMTRAYFFGNAGFGLPGDFALDLDAELVTDRGYLLTYGYSDEDRLSSGAEISRTRRDEHVSTRFVKLRTLRESEIPRTDTLATLQGLASYERRLTPSGIGGEARLRFDLFGFERAANPDDLVSMELQQACNDPEVTCTSRDVFRTGVSTGWRRDWLLANGAVADVEGQIAAAAYWIGQDETIGGQDAKYPSWLRHAAPAVSASLRWPASRMSGSGALDVLEPVAQIAWTDSYGRTAPNEDSLLVEFDEGNLLSLSRFPGSDLREQGWRATLGLSWSRFAPGGSEYALTAGRVVRAENLEQFSEASGLDGAISDWLVAGRVGLDDRLSLINRSIFDDSLDFSKSETRLAWSGRDLTASTGYVWVIADQKERRANHTSEWNMDGALSINDRWTGAINWRYDLRASRATRAGLGLEYRNECVSVDLSLSRRFTSSTELEPTTDIGLNVRLNGFGSDGRPYRRNCAVVN